MEKKIKKEIILFLTFILLLSINLVYAVPDFGSIPPIPDHFSGNVLIDTQNASVGTILSVYVDSILEFNYNITEVGRYDLYVKSGNAGDVIEFKILDKIAGASTRQGGKTINLNLSISTAPESSPPSSPPSSSGGSSGGGGGGGSSGGGSSLGRVTYSSPQQQTNNNTINLNQEEEEKETEKIGDKSPLTSLTVLDFVKSGKGMITLGIIIFIILIGVMIIKFKPLKKWIKKSQ